MVRSGGLQTAIRGSANAGVRASRAARQSAFVRRRWSSTLSATGVATPPRRRGAGPAARAGGEGRRTGTRRSRCSGERADPNQRSAGRHDGAALGGPGTTTRRSSTGCSGPGPDAHPENRYGTTPIALACESGSAAIVERLLKAGVSANATGPYGETALHTCAHAGNTAAARVLIAAGASVDPGDSWRGQTPAHVGGGGGPPRDDAGADRGGRRRRMPAPRSSSGSGSARTSRATSGCRRAAGRRSSSRRARTASTCVDVLAAAGADLNIVDPERHTALIIALINGHFDVAGRLIDRGADLNMQDKVGQTALWAAVDAHTMPDFEPSGTHGNGRHADRLGHRHEAGERGRQGGRPAAPARSLPHEDRPRRATASSAPARPRCCAQRRRATPRSSSCCWSTGRTRGPSSAAGVTRILLAANVGTSESDRTGRHKTETARSRRSAC